MARMMAVQVAQAGETLEVVDREIPRPGPGQVRIRVLACGICHSDALVREGHWPGIQYPRVPGHEVAGTIEELGPGVEGWAKGQRVGVGWFGGQCGHCPECQRGDFISCRNLQVCGISYDGGYEEYMIAPANALARLPEGISAEDAAPLLCAGVTTFNSLRRSGAIAGDLVAIQGVGGLGHLGIQFAHKMGYKVAAISRGAHNAELARKLGAHHYIDGHAINPAEELAKLGGARIILATAPSGKSMSPLIEGLGLNGKLLVVGASAEPIEVTPIQLIRGRRCVQGWPSGTSADSEDTLNFAVTSGVRPMIEKFPLERANEAYDRMISGKAEFRAVLVMAGH